MDDSLSYRVVIVDAGLEKKNRYKVPFFLFFRTALIEARAFHAYEKLKPG